MVMSGLMTIALAMAVFGVIYTFLEAACRSERSRLRSILPHAVAGYNDLHDSGPARAPWARYVSAYPLFYSKKQNGGAFSV